MSPLRSTVLAKALLTGLAALLACRAPADEPPAISLPADRALRAGFLIVDGVYNTELMAPWDVFQHTVHHAQSPPGIEVLTVAPSSDPITTAEGLRIVPDYTFDNAPPLDILVVPSATGSRDDDRANPDLIAWVREVGSRARLVMSLCWGAFILAEAGLLDGHACTTFPADYRRFAESFPSLDLRINVSFVHDGKVLTSQGGSRSYDAAMYLVDLLFGETTARGVGDGLLIDWPPPLDGRYPFVSDPRMTRRADDATR